jgi:FkbM family methyltransferase
MTRLEKFLRKIVRAGVLRKNGPTRIAFGPNKGLRMVGLSVSNVLSTTEPHLQGIIRNHALPGTWVLDIGANVGFFTLMLSRAVGAQGKVIAVEAIPATFAVLKLNLELNAIGNVDAMNMAASDRYAELEFRVPRYGPSMASYYWHREAPDVERVRVQAVPLDGLEALRGKKVSFVKIDVEGAEGDVLQGMRAILDESRPVVFIECSEIGRKATWATLSDRGYRCFIARAPASVVVSVDDYRHDDFLWLP